VGIVHTKRRSVEGSRRHIERAVANLSAAGSLLRRRIRRQKD
jgi:hypothetical protein